jgi:hypothetical protein
MRAPPMLTHMMTRISCGPVARKDALKMLYAVGEMLRAFYDVLTGSPSAAARSPIQRSKKTASQARAL